MALQNFVVFCQTSTWINHQFGSVQSLSHVQLFKIPWIAARQASLSITNSRSLLKLMSIKSVMPSSHLILCRPLLLLPPIPPSIRVVSNESTLRMMWPKYWSDAMILVFWMLSFKPTFFTLLFHFHRGFLVPLHFLPSGRCQLFAWSGQSIGVSASATILPMNTHHWSPLGWTGWIFLQSKDLSRVFTNTTVQKHQYFGAQLSSQSNSHIHTWPLEKPLALFVVMLSKAHLTSHSRISGSRWVVTPSWLSGSWRSFLYIGIHISPPS